MEAGEILTRGSIWAALLLYSAGRSTQLLALGRENWERNARGLSTLGCGACLLHVAFALQHFHHWSQSAAWEDTARQTAELTGWRWGGGLIVNYIFSALWIADTVWWWRGLLKHRNRARWISRSWHGFYLFMAFNGAVVFVHGPQRWAGLALCLWVAGVWIYAARDGWKKRRDL